MGNGAIRWEEFDSAGVSQGYKWLLRADEPSEAGTALSKANLLPDATETAIFGNASDRTPSEAFVQLAIIEKQNFINILRLKLQQALSASDIDAWSDVFTSDALFDLSNSNNFVLSTALSVFAISQTGGSWDLAIGNLSVIKNGQTFLTSGAVNSFSVTVKLQKYGSPTDNVLMKIYATSAGVPTGAALYTSSDTVSGASLSTSYSEHTFTFSAMTLSAATTYAFVLERSSVKSNTNYFKILGNSTGTYEDGGDYVYDSGGSWSSAGGEL